MTDTKSNEYLVRRLNSEDTIERQNARSLLVERGQEAVPFLLKALKSPRHWVRWEAAKALAQIGDNSAIDDMVLALADPEFDVRWIAAEGLIAIGPAALPAVLKELVDEPESPVVKESVHHVLHDMKMGDLAEMMDPIRLSLEGTGPLEPEVIAEETLNKLKDLDS